jgi:protein glucosyltransferase
MDGNTAPTARSNKLMYLGSVVMRQESHYVEFWYDSMKPYENYIPLSYDGSDIIDKVEWARAHDDVAERIAKNAVTMARKHLRDDEVSCYWHRLLVEYSKRMNFNVTLTSQFSRVRYDNAQAQKLIQTESEYCDFAKDWLKEEGSK